MKIFAASFCFGLLPLLSVIILLESVHGRPYLAQGNELFPDKGDLNHEELLLAFLNKNFDFQRPSKKDVELDNKLEEFNQTEELKRQLTKEKQAKIFYAINDLFPSHPNKPGADSALL
ncbi:PREDICTED: urotensin-2B [Chinchilla lanigera]|uniref:urotensin-2B n=1 Tax=Chinchilla lanigera TaxID=34839 RepID=UPI000698E18C|nr:PREDICTED: urotensin-2B [Chinchilla lanigera]